MPAGNESDDAPFWWSPPAWRRVLAPEALWFVSPHSPEVCAERLAGSLSTPFLGPGSSGAVSTDRFALRLNHDLVALGPFSPEATGRFVPTDEGTRVEVRIAVPERWLLSGGVLTGIGLGFWLAAGVRFLAGGPLLGAEPAAWVLGMLFLPVGLGWFGFGVWLHRELRRSALKAFLRKTLDAREVRPAGVERADPR